ncbi:hypothetical protein AB6A40_009615 [Gnathostoma spinigerum]|uniref:Uncharacterized protein n=1 Tax=Gnathostoma spinigerum TaxID=75299 RepID=A0ABD6EU95_9BILA
MIVNEPSFISECRLTLTDDVSHPNNIASTKELMIAPHSWITSVASLDQTLSTRSSFSRSSTSASFSDIANDRTDETTDSGTDFEGTETSNESETSSSPSQHSSSTSVDFPSLASINDQSNHAEPTKSEIKDNIDAWRFFAEETVFRRPPPKKAVLKVRPRGVQPKLDWLRCFHEWAIRQSPIKYHTGDYDSITSEIKMDDHVPGDQVTEGK